MTQFCTLTALKVIKFWVSDIVIWLIGFCRYFGFLSMKQLVCTFQIFKMIWELIIWDFFYYNKLPCTNVIWFHCQAHNFTKRTLWVRYIMKWQYFTFGPVYFILFEIQTCPMLFEHVNYQLCPKIKFSFCLAVNVIVLSLKEYPMNGINKIFFFNRTKYSTINRT